MSKMSDNNNIILYILCLDVALIILVYCVNHRCKNKKHNNYNIMCACSLFLSTLHSVKTMKISAHMPLYQSGKLLLLFDIIIIIIIIIIVNITNVYML